MTDDRSPPTDDADPLGLTLSAATSEQQQRLVEVLDRYVAALDSGTAPPADELLAAHPDLADELAECLEGVEAIHQAVKTARAEEPAKQAAPSASHEAPQQIGDYAIRREIGRGGMGVVYEAEEGALRRRVALKVLPFAAVLDQKQIARFRNEAQAAAQLHHPHIVPVFSIGQDRGVHFYAMQHIEGRSVAQAIDELRREAGEATTLADSLAETLSTTQPPEPPPTRPSRSGSPRSGSAGEPTTPSLGPTHRSGQFFDAVARLGADIADALHHAHEYGVVHRDVKPSNLLLDAAGKAWITDFGLARVQTELGVTATGDVVGTLRYMSPEQARGRADQVDGRTDVYGLGATLYELMTLQHAHRGDNRQQVLDRIERNDPIRPRRINPHVPPDLESIVGRAMDKDPASRYPTAAAMAEDLRRFLAGLPTVARPPGPLRLAGKWLARRRRFVAGLAAASLVVALVAVAGAVGIFREQQRTAAALVEAQRQTANAELRFSQAREVVDRFGADLSDRLALLPGSESLRRELLDQTLGYYQQFLAQATDEPGLYASVAETRVKAAAAAERLGRIDEALALYTQAVEQLRATDTPTDESRSWLARAATNRANLLASRGQRERAIAAFDEAIVVAQRLTRSSEPTPERLDQLAGAMIAKAAMLADTDPSAAEDLLDDAIGRLADGATSDRADPALARRLAIAHSTRSEAIRERDPREARRSASRAVTLLRDLVAERPEIDVYRADLAMALSNRAALAADRGRLDDASAAYRLAIDELGRLVDRSPMIPRHRAELAVAEANLALVLARRGEERGSDRWFDRADERLAQLAADFPANTRSIRQRAAMWNNRGVALRDRGRLPDAAEAFRQSVELEKRRLAALPPGAPTLLALHYANHAQVLGRLGRLDEAARVETERRELLAAATGPTATQSGEAFEASQTASRRTVAKEDRR
ncbi:MAG: protein kinase [Planctomycetota bacterium]